MSGFDLAPPSADQRAALEAMLSPDEKRVLLEHGTERAFCGVFGCVVDAPRARKIGRDAARCFHRLRKC